MPMSFPVDPAEGEIFNLTANRKYKFTDGRWQMYRNNLPQTESTSNMIVPAVSPTPPEFPSLHALWFNPETSTMHFQYDDGDSVQWVAI
jgi:hypothetical protein